MRCVNSTEEVNFADCGSQTVKTIRLKFVTFDYVHHAIAQAKSVVAAYGGLGGHIGEVVSSSRAFIHFSFISCSFNISTAYPEMRGILLNAPKMYFGDACIPLGQFVQGSNLPTFTPKPFFNGPINAITQHWS